MQISPVGAEGSNVMPGQPARAEAAEVRRQGAQNSLLTHVGRDGTPHAGSTAGEAAHPSTAMCLHSAKPAGKVRHARGLLTVAALYKCVNCLTVAEKRLCFLPTVAAPYTWQPYVYTV